MDEAMNQLRGLIVLVVSLAALQGCAEKIPPYGVEGRIGWPGHKRQVWAVAPAINLSGQNQVDPLIQADLLFQQLQEVNGITVIPVNRVVEVYASLQIEKVQSEEQAKLVCDLLGCDGLVVASITLFDPYNPPKFGAAIQLFARPGSFTRSEAVDVRQLVRSASPGPNDSVPAPASFLQSTGVFDAANGSVRESLLSYAAGRNDPLGPMGAKEYFMNMDRYCGFVYHRLIEDLIGQVR
jgi:hypothetical protein